MRWVPEWLGSSFARLSMEYGKGYFSAEEAQGTLGMPLGTVRVVLSKLSREEYLEKRREGRKVLYRCVDPYEVILRVGGDISIPQDDYVPLARDLVAESLKLLGEDLVSIVLYGSIARGEADENSDMDVLIVARNLPSEFSERVGGLYPIKRACQGTRMHLWEEEGIYCSIQIYPLSPEELDDFRPIFLEVTADGRLLFDRRGFMKKKLKEWRERLSELGARRVQLPDGSWYWDLNPEGRRVVEI